MHGWGLGEVGVGEVVDVYEEIRGENREVRKLRKVAEV